MILIGLAKSQNRQWINNDCCWKCYENYIYLQDFTTKLVLTFDADKILQTEIAGTVVTNTHHKTKQRTLDLMSFKQAKSPALRTAQWEWKKIMTVHQEWCVYIISWKTNSPARSPSVISSPKIGQEIKLKYLSHPL